MMLFLERIASLLSSRSITRNKLCTDIGLNKNSFFDWERRGTVPSGEVVAKIADYFNVSTDYLLGRTDQPEEQVQAYLAQAARENLTDADEQRLLDDYRSLNPQGQEYIRQTMHMAVQIYKKSSSLSELEGQG